MNEDDRDSAIIFKCWDDFAKSIWSKRLTESEHQIVVRYQWTTTNLLQLMVVQLQVSKLVIIQISVNPDEEQMIRKWLTEMFKLLVEQWKPLTARGLAALLSYDKRDNRVSKRSTRIN